MTHLRWPERRLWSSGDPWRFEARHRIQLPGPRVGASASIRAATSPVFPLEGAAQEKLDAAREFRRSIQ